MAVGDRLVVTLSTNRLMARWALTGFPRASLATELSAAPVGGFGLVARAAGSGPVMLTRSGCGLHGDEPCTGGGGISPGPSSAPGATTWTITVVVR